MGAIVNVTPPDADGVVVVAADHPGVTEELHLDLVDAIELRNQLTRMLDRVVADGTHRAVMG